MRRGLLVLAALAVGAPAAAGAPVTAYSLGTVGLQVQEWDSSLHDLNVGLGGHIAVPVGVAAAPVVVIEHGSYPVSARPVGRR